MLKKKGASDIKELERVHRLLTEAMTQELEFIIDWNSNLESIREAWDKDSGLPYPVRISTPPSLIAAVSKFLTAPSDFSLYTSLWTLPKPVWGTCPRGEVGQ